MAAVCRLPDPLPWYLQPWLQRLGLAALVIVLIVEGIICTTMERNDFTTHLALGQQFVKGQPYRGPSGYLLPRLAWNGMLAQLPPLASRLFVYLLALLAWGATFYAWKRLSLAAQGVSPVDAARPAARTAIKTYSIGAMLLAVFAFLTYFARDADEAGLQAIVVGMLSLAALALYQRQSVTCGMWIALATAFKTTPLLFVPYLIWKREWKAAASAVVCLVALNLLPAAYLGWEGMLAAHGKWYRLAASELAAGNPYETQFEPGKVQNIGLKPAICRYLMTFPPGHSLHIEHPAFVQFGQLSLDQVKPIIHGVLGLLALSLAWRFRRRFTHLGDDLNDPSRAAIAPEWAAVGLLSALLSPQCWKQHLVIALPSMFLVIHFVLPQWRRFPLRTCGVFLVWLLAAGIPRPLLGRELAVVLVSYRLDTLAMLLLMGLVLTLPHAADSAAASEESRDAESAGPEASVASPPDLDAAHDLRAA